MREDSLMTLEWNADMLSIDVHATLVGYNLREFGNSGYDGMAALTDGNHTMYTWNDDNCTFIDHFGFYTYYGVVHHRVIHPTIA